MSLRAISASASGSGGSIPQKLGGSAIPFVIAPTGSMANNGAITLGTALGTTYAACYLNLPANAISAGSGAGWYYTVMSSPTVGQVFNNTYTTGAPSIPASPTAFATTGPGAYTGVTSQVSGPQLTIPAGVPGANGALRITTLWSALNNAGAKTVLCAIASINVLNASAASVGSLQAQSLVYNRGVQNSNIALPAANQSGLGTAGGNATATAINFAVATTLVIAATIATATDFLVLEAYLIEVLTG